MSEVKITVHFQVLYCNNAEGDDEINFDPGEIIESIEEVIKCRSCLKDGV